MSGVGSTTVKGPAREFQSDVVVPFAFNSRDVGFRSSTRSNGRVDLSKSLVRSVNTGWSLT